MLHIAPEGVRLSACMSKIDEFLARSRALKADILRRLEQVEQTIRTFEQLKKTLPAADLERILTRTETGATHSKPNFEAIQEAPKSAGSAATPAEVVSLTQSALMEAGRPMRRGELVRALQARGVALAGKDPNKNLGTILWRHPASFVSLSHGYWIRGVPLEGIYDPEEFKRQEEEEAYAKYRSIRFEIERLSADHAAQSLTKRHALSIGRKGLEDRFPSFSDRWQADPFR